MTSQALSTETTEVTSFVWGSPHLELTFAWTPDAPVWLAGAIVGGRSIRFARIPLVELVTASGGHTPASDRLAHSTVGARLRHIEHREVVADAGRVLVIAQSDGDLEVVIRLEMLGAAAVRSQVTVANRGAGTAVLRSVSSWTQCFTDVDADADPLSGWTRITGRSDWLGEGRWERESLRGDDFPRLAEHLTGHNPRGSLAVTSDGTWSTGRSLPTAALERDGLAIAWQIEHNGAWRWEIGEDTTGGYISLSGPTDSDSAWTLPLGAGASFTSVPVTVAYATDATEAFAALTDHRRAARRPHPDNSALPVVFNDYMNTLNGDPTTEKLLPLVAAAAEIGAEIFCIDAGWYDDSGHWWDSVGEWRPSTTRFPGGLAEVVDAIRDAGMVPGLWLEPEVIGVRSPMATRLPDDAFFQRHGVRIVEHDRYHLDLRHPAAIAHLDEVVDRLVAEFGIGFFKLDYNINPGPGTDVDAPSVGAGLLDHNRAHLAWLDGVLDRHPDLVIENCASGAMRMDFGMLSRLAMQSTSDQQDFAKYPPIAASAPLSMLPEQAASWAYPQPDMTAEEVAFCLVTGLLGRYYVSGHLNEMDAVQRALVAEAVGAAKQLRGSVSAGHAHWPLGLPAWDAPWVALGVSGDSDDIVSIWRRGGSGSTTLALPHLAGREIAVSTVFPQHLPEWQSEWDATTGTLTVHATDATIAARTLRLAISPNRPAQGTATPNRSE
ncbi:glycoside hydrolase family 36 protein [Microbacterium terricola]|uniref:Alpha-galactosidase n=1 Tax=Microbacterium terricola TaxID=344163 RepID=A0ABM8E1Q2_9MICO|nr:glycoside hydrolase family 36 protein [Microbacterium terricola]UYK40419.1 alpha-galactosidase [Microbacterium terricola]BDV31863.1 hypothetical protein Microterr_25230 [Microbacterium terricola]